MLQLNVINSSNIYFQLGGFTTKLNFTLVIHLLIRSRIIVLKFCFNEIFKQSYP